MRGSHLVGVAVFSHPCNDAVLTSVFGGEATESVELGRFVLLDDVAGNGETWFLAWCFDVLRKRELRGVVAFSDPHPRHDVSGRVVMPGHIGVISQAHNGHYLGRSRKRTLYLLPDGAVFSARAASKVRRRMRSDSRPSFSRRCYATHDAFSARWSPPARASFSRNVRWLRVPRVLTAPARFHWPFSERAWVVKRVRLSGVPALDDVTVLSTGSKQLRWQVLELPRVPSRAELLALANEAP